MAGTRGEAPRRRRCTALLCVEGVSLRLGGTDVLSGVSLQVEPGQIHGLLGPNGSGKSTLAYVIMGCPGYVPGGGLIRFAGRDLSGLSMTGRARLGITLAWQEPARFEGLTVRDYVRLGTPGADPDWVAGSLESVALSPRAYLGRPVDRTLSGGERKRIELAAVLAMRPRLAILDEPDSGVDALALETVAAVVRRMAGTGTAVLLITHRDEMAGAADTASLMDRGSVIAAGLPADVRARYRGHSRQREPTLNAPGSLPSPAGEGAP